METKYIVATIVVVIVIAAVAAVVLVTSDGNEDEETNVSVGEDGRLMIYGNANNDDYLDEQDIEYLEAIIAGEAEETQYADANQDGVIDEEDIEFVQRMIDREPMTIFYYNALTEEATAIDYPITNVVTVVAEVCLANKILGNTENMVGYYGSLDSVLFSDIPEDAVQFSSSGEISIEALSEMDIDAIVTLPATSYVTNEQEITDNGINILRLGFRDADPTPAYITYGFLLGQEERAASYVQFVEETLEYIDEVVSASVADEDRVTAMDLGGPILYGNISNYGATIEMAGGINMVDWYEHRYYSDGIEWLYEYDFEYLIGRGTEGGYDIDEEEYESLISAMDSRVERYKLTEAVQMGNNVYVNTAVPTIINAAYMAAEFYPDLFPENFGDIVHQQYVDLFIDNLSEIGYDVSDGLFFYRHDTSV